MATKKQAEQDTTKQATAAKPRRKPRTVEEQIADLQAKAAAQKERKVQRLTKQLEVARGQQAAAAERLDLINARVAELEKALGISSDEADKADEAEAASSDEAEDSGSQD